MNNNQKIKCLNIIHYPIGLIFGIIISIPFIIFNPINDFLLATIVMFLLVLFCLCFPIRLIIKLIDKKIDKLQQDGKC